MFTHMAYSVEEIHPCTGGYCFWTGDDDEMIVAHFADDVLGCLENMGNKLTDYGVSVSESAGVIYIVRSHFALPIVGV